MNYVSLSFYAFLPLFLIAYYIVPQKYRYIVITIGSYIFYGYTSIRMLIVLSAITVISYFGGLVIEKKRTRLVYAVFFVLNILILAFFKYSIFALENIGALMNQMGMSAVQLIQPDILLPVGLSFIIFQVCTYFGDIYKNNIEAERNILRYAAFVAFFPTVLSGPIQKARDLMPQIKTPGAFDYEQAKKGTILFVWGLFEKIVVANRLLLVTNRVFQDYTSYNSAYYIIAGICFSLYIYADFSSYSDMARGISKIMGIRIGKNFNNPYLSRTTSEFWNRWHISLNSWFIEYVYIPLGGNRKGKTRKYVNVFIVFLLSGLWHGASYHFIVWGTVNGILVIIGQILKPAKDKAYSRLGIDQNLGSIVLCKRLIVFWLITLTWVFFNNGLNASFHIISNMVFFNPFHFFDENLLFIDGNIVSSFVTMVATVLFSIVQTKRQNESVEYRKYRNQPYLFQLLVMAALICTCILASCTTDAAVNSQFLYFQF